MSDLTKHEWLACDGFSKLISLCHNDAVIAGWWSDPKTHGAIDRNDGELIALMHSELSEALEGLRKGKADEHLPNRTSVEVELADLIIRVCDYAGKRKLDLGGAIADKLVYNRTRADHKLGARAEDGGKKF